MLGRECRTSSRPSMHPTISKQVRGDARRAANRQGVLRTKTGLQSAAAAKVHIYPPPNLSRDRIADVKHVKWLVQAVHHIGWQVG